MRRNHENTNGIVAANHYQLKELQGRVIGQEEKISFLYENAKKENFNRDMQAPDLGQFFPVQTPDQLEKFMDRTHPEWDARRQEFYNLLYTCISDQKNNFSKGLIYTLFTQDYIKIVKWPSSG